MPSSPSPLLLVGLRRGVLPAIRKVGRPAFALLDRRRERPAWATELSGTVEVDMHGAPAAIERAARGLLGDASPAAVVALAERTVVVAAELRRAFGVPGNDPQTATCCADKLEMKRAMSDAGVPVAPWFPVEPGTSAKDLLTALGPTVVLKPRRDSGGRGQVVARDAATLARELATLPALSTGWLAEGWLEGVEMSVESFVVDGDVRFSNPTEYLVPRHANVVPAELDEELWASVRAFAARALRAAGVTRGMSHLELFRGPSGLVFGELAIRPPGGRIMSLMRSAWGFDPWAALVRLELGEPFEFPRIPRRSSGVWVLHPGAGRVRRIEGLAEARSLPHVRRIDLRARAGDEIPERVGSGQDVGTIRVDGPDRDAVASALHRAHDTLRIELETTAS